MSGKFSHGYSYKVISDALSSSEKQVSLMLDCEIAGTPVQCKLLPNVAKLHGKDQASTSKVGRSRKRRTFGSDVRLYTSVS